MNESSHEITALVLAWNAGEPGARDRLVPIVYRELRRRAAAQLRRERRGEDDARRLADALVEFRRERLHLDPEVIVVDVWGRTRGGVPFAGTDIVQIVP